MAPAGGRQRAQEATAGGRQRAQKPIAGGGRRPMARVKTSAFHENNYAAAILFASLTRPIYCKHISCSRGGHRRRHQSRRQAESSGGPSRRLVEGPGGPGLEISRNHAAFCVARRITTGIPAGMQLQGAHAHKLAGHWPLHGAEFCLQHAVRADVRLRDAPCHL